MEQEPSQTVNSKKTSAFREAVSGAPFIEKMILLVLTALTSGMLVPYIGDKIQATKARNEVIQQAKAKLLDDITHTIITYEYLAGDVSYYRFDSATNNEKMFTQAFERYAAKTPDLMAQWGVDIAKAKTLVSPAISSKLENFMDKVLTEQEVKLVSLYNRNAGIPEWSTMNELTGTMYEEAKKLIEELASDLELTNPDIKQNKSTKPSS